MIQEEKQLLLKDICARLPYGVIIRRGYVEFKLHKISDERVNDLEKIEDCKPYLRPMSSMTDEELEEFRTLILPKASCAYEDCLEWDTQIISGGYLQISIEDFSKVVDWLNKHHLDWRGLIKKSLAIVAPEGMYD